MDALCQIKRRSELVRRTSVAYVILAAISAFLLTLTKKIFLVTCRPVKLLHSYNVVDVESIYLLGKQFTPHVGLQTSNLFIITSKILIV